MRMTVTLDDDVLAAVRSRAETENRTIGDVFSSLARSALSGQRQTASRNGLPIMQRAQDCHIVTMEIVNALRDDGA